MFIRKIILLDQNDFNKVIGNKKNLKVFSIMCNAWPDFPNMYKKNIFNDYVDWCLFIYYSKK